MKTSNGSPPAPYDYLVHKLITEHCKWRPDSEAACSSRGESMSYRALDESSELLSHQLTAHGVGPEVIVPLCFEKSIWTVVAIMAVLKAGGAFVLLDPAHPTERLETIMQKCKATIAITSSSTQGRISQLVPLALCIDRDTLGHLQPVQHGRRLAARPSNAAYIVYTSGSTGQPKGAVIEHGSFCAGALGHAEAMHMDASTRAVQFASYNFDASITEMLTTLVVGGTVCVLEEADRLDPLSFTAAVKRMRANFALLTASFINALPVDGLSSLRTLVQGGEALPEAVLKQWADRVALMSAYGQVEASVVATCTKPISSQSKANSIGSAVAGRCWVVDPEDPNSRTEPGKIGELLVEGPHVGRGYLDEPEKTAAVFIGRPYWHTRLFPTECDARALRFYRTGDLVIQENDGSFTFAGRKDEQVKVNGQRIELGEIEHQFKRAMQPPREIAVELVKRQLHGAAVGTLIGFVALDGDWNDDEEAAQRVVDAEISAAEEKVRAVLPKFMIPSSFLAIQHIPISMNGKVDRKYLRALGQARLLRKQPPVEPPAFSCVEEHFRQIWSRVLNVQEGQIGRTSVFQSLGGDSISAMQVVSQAASRGIRITVQQILKKKTIEGIAAELDSLSSSSSSSLSSSSLSLSSSSLSSLVSSSSSVVEKVHVDEDEEDIGVPFKLSPVQQLFFQLSPDGENRDNISFLLSLNKRVSPLAVDEAIEAIVLRHPMLRARFFQLKRGSWFQYISDETSESYHFSSHFVDSLSSDVMRTVRRSQRGIDIRLGPLIRADLFTSLGEGQVLFVCAHHLVSDFVSWRIILQELEEHIQTGAISSPQGFSFQRWCREQEKHVRGLATHKLPFELPVPDYTFWNMQGTVNVYGDAITETTTFENELSSIILASAPDHVLEAEVLDVLLAAVMFAFHKAFPERQVPAFFVENHGREPFWDDSIDLSSTVGWFTTILPIVVSETKYSNAIDVVREIKDLRAKFPDKGLAHFASQYFRRKQERDAGRAADARMEVTFNYAGKYQQLERHDGLFTESSQYSLMNLDGFGTALPRFGLIEILGNVERGRLKLSFTFNKRMRHQRRIRLWIQECQRTLADIASVITQKRHYFPLLHVPESGMARLVDSVLPQIGVKMEHVEDIYPCSPMQNGMLLSRAVERGSYMSQLYLEIRSKEGDIDASRIERAWQAVVDRHAALRTVFVESVRSDGTFDQVVLRQVQAVVSRGYDRSEGDAVGTWAANQPQHHLFILQQSSRAATLRLEISHVLLDGSSTPLLMRDLQRGYDNLDLLLSTQRPLYSSYIKHVSSLSHESSVEYWTKHLSGAIPCHLPQWSSETEGALKLITVPPIRSSETRAFCRQHGITISDLLKATWAIVLRSYTGCNAPVFGYLSSSRSLEYDESIGVFTNIQPCFTRILPHTTVLEHVKKIVDDGLDQIPHRECPLADVMHVAALGDAAREGLFNTAMSLQRVAPATSDSSLSIRMIREQDPTEYAATFLGYVSDAEIELKIAYWTSKLSSGQAQHLAATVSKVISSMCESPHATIDSLDVLSQMDWDSIKRWNARLDSSSPVDNCIHRLIENISTTHPDRQAVHAWDGKLTYAQLDEISSRLAGHLYSLGLRPDQVVPVYMEKSMWAIVSMLSVLKAGGAFVPLDPDAPLDRIQRLLTDVSASFTIVSSTMADRLPDSVQRIVVSRALITKLPRRSFPESVTPDKLAYVLFTSGTTGTPKGIMMQHSQFLASSMRYSSVLGLNETSRVLQFSAYTFDASIFEIWSTLTTGGCVCQISDSHRMNDVAGAINKFDANTMFMTPTMLSMLDPDDIPCIHTIITGGEVIHRDIFRTWAPTTRLIEAYGPTETAVYATFQTDIGPESDRFCIGRSFCCRVWVVDAANTARLVPVGAVGELWLEGPSLARGYLNADEQTAAAFVKRPDWVNPAQLSRYYRTGDLVRYKTDGSLQFCGRKDTQVKVRGQRIELSEVEQQAALVVGKNLPLVAEVVDSKLLLLIEARNVSDERVASAVAALETQLPSRLPRYMVPSATLPVLEPFPRTSSGKLDRKKLRVIAGTLRSKSREAGAMKECPAKGLEVKLLTIVARVLGLPAAQIQREDNFYSLGGDSLLAMRLVAAARDEGLHLPIASILRTPILSELAKVMEAENDAPTESSDVKPFALVGDLAASMRAEAAAFCGVSKGKIEDVYPVTPLQEALVVESAKYPTAYTAHHVVELSEDVDLRSFRAAWAVCVEENPILRTRIFQTVTTKPPRPVQAVLHMERIEWESGDDLQAYLTDARQSPSIFFNKVAIINDAASHTRYFVWLAHHALYDGHSLSLILQRLHDIYTNKARTVATYLPFRTYIAHVRTILASRAVSNFWCSYLKGAPTPSFPPTRSSSSPSSITHADNVCDFTLRLPLPKNGTATLPVTLATILRTAWGLVMTACSSRTGKDSEPHDVVFGTIVSGRSAALDGIATVVGPTIAAIPVRVTCRREESMRDVLVRVQEQAVAMMPYEVVGLRRIQKLSADTERACRFGSLLVVQPSAKERNVPYRVVSQALDVGRSYSYPLTVECEELDGRVLHARVTYASEVLTVAQVKSLMHQFEQVVQRLLTDSGSLTVEEIIPKVVDLSIPSASSLGSTGEVSTARSSPVTEMERQLQEFWAESLELQAASDISVDADFLRTGGDSITAMQLSGVARREGFLLRVPDILNKPRLREMALCMTVLDLSVAMTEEEDPPAFSLLPAAMPIDDYVTQAAADVGLCTDDIEDMYPCTPLQEGLMTASLTQPGAYRAQLVVDLSSDINISRLKAAWEIVVSAHPITRTRIVHLGAAGMFQIVLRATAPSIHWNVADSLDEYVEQDIKTPMSLGDALIRFGVVSDNGAGAKFVWTAHHAVYDGATVTMLSEDVAKAYSGSSVDKPPPFSRFMKYLSGLKSTDSDDFWRTTLAGAKPMPFPLPLSLDYTPRADSVMVRSITLPRSRPTSRFTIPTVLQAAWALLLSRYTGTYDVVLGVAQSGRLIPVPSIAAIPGPTLVTVPLRVVLNPQRTVAGLLENVQQSSLAATAHYHHGLQSIRRVSADASQACEFRALLTMVPREEEMPAPFDLRRARVLENGTQGFHTYPLLLECAFDHATVKVTAMYDARVVESRMMKCILVQLEHVMTQLVSDDSAAICVGEIDVLTSEDYASAAGRQAWIVDINNGDYLAPSGVLGELVVGHPGDINAKEVDAIQPRWLRKLGGCSPQQVYSTGKLSRLDLDGHPEVVGEKHELVNLNGRRFFARDIERLISQAMWNRSVALHVSISPEEEGSPPLIAYVELEHGFVDDQAAQKLLDALVASAEDRLNRTLPAFMVPDRFVPIRCLPRAEDGSVARLRLTEIAAAPGATPQPADKTIRSQKNGHSDVQRVMVALWKKVLRLEDVDVDDSFLRLGGDSVDAMKLVAEARRQGIVLTVRDIFANPILSHMVRAAKVATKTAPDAIAPFSLLGDDARDIVEEVAAACEVETQSIEDVYPCTPLQEGLMALSDVEAGAYVAECIVPVPDAEKTMAAWSALVAQTPVLRTRIIQSDRYGFLQVVIQEKPEFSLGESLEEYLASGRQVPMSCGNQLVRAGIITQGNSTQFVLFAHHAIFDGWSWELLLHRLHQFYKGQVLQPSPPYSRFIRYLHQDLNFQRASDFWRSYLEGAEQTVFPLVSSAAVPKPDSHETRHIHLVRQDRASAHTTSSMIQTAWALLVSRYVDSTDVVIGVNLSGRTASIDGIQDIIGPTFTTVPLRFVLEATKTVGELCDGAQNISVSPEQHLGLQRIQQVSPCARASCNFSSLLVIQPASNNIDGDNFFIRENKSQLVSSFTNYSLGLVCQLLPDGNLDASAVFDSHLVQQQQVVRLLAQFEHVLRQVHNHDNLTVEEVDFFSPEDRMDVAEWNNGADMGPNADLCLHTLVERHAQDRPDAPAVCSWDGDLTYGALNALASKLAGHLVGLLNVGPETLIPLCFEKSKWTLVAMLGVLKTGAAFVLLDPAHPDARLESICGKINATLAIVSAGQDGRLSRFVTTTFVLNQQTLNLLQSPNPLTFVKPSDAAYASTTSGTTGEPKVCVIEHRSIVAAAMAFGAMANLEINTRAMQFASYSFDVSLIETLMIWVAGGCICVLSETDRKDNIEGAVTALGINWVVMTPALAGMLKPDSLPSVRTMVLGGEALTPELIKIWSGNLNLLQGYGPCECTPVACCSPAPLHNQSNPRNIGRPLKNVHAWIVDPSSHKKLAPVGSIGELVLEGPTVGRGYVGESEKTIKSCIAPPTWRNRFPGQPERFYKTGDLVRYDSDGTLVFVGRKDSQVKLRGQRLELAEIEHHLRRSMARPCEVAVELISPKDGTSANALLAAFVALGDAFGASQQQASRMLKEVLGDAKTALSQVLPSYMVPSAYVPLTRLPLSISGKVDRKALRQMGVEDAGNHDDSTDSRREGRAPQTPTEQMLQSLWARILNIEMAKIHSESNFLELGGDSLSAMKLTSKIREAGVSLGVVDIMRCPRFADMAAACMSLAETDAIPEYKPLSTFSDIVDLDDFLRKTFSIDPSRVEDVVEATSTQKRMTAASMSPQHGAINHVWLDFMGQIDVQRLKNACSTIVSHHGILRTVFMPFKERLMQVIYRVLEPDFDEIIAEGDIEETTAASVQASRSLGEQYGKHGLRFSLIHYHANNQPASRLIIRLPHSLYDGVSLPMVLHDLQAAYENHDLLPSTSFSRHLHVSRYLQANGNAKDFWRKHLEGSSMTQIFERQGHDAAHISDVNRHLSRRLPLSLFLTTKHTFETFFHTSWALVLHELAGGTSDIVFGRAVANRHLPLSTFADNVMGPTLNTVPVRIQVHSDKLLNTLLSSVEDGHLAALPHTYLETDTIVADCTCWPRSHTRFGSLLAYNNLDAAKSNFAGDGGHSFSNFCGTPCTLGWAAAPWDTADVNITATPEPDEEAMRFDLAFADAVVSTDLAEKMLGALCRTVERLCCEGPECDTRIRDIMKEAEDKSSIYVSAAELSR